MDFIFRDLFESSLFMFHIWEIFLWKGEGEKLLSFWI